MNGSYVIYKRNRSTGIKGTLVQRYTSFQINLNWGEISKFQITGSTIGDVDLEPGDGLVWYRNYDKFFSGIIDTVEIACTDAAADLKTWTAAGSEDSVIFSRWLAFADPVTVSFADGVVDKFTGYADARQLHYIRYNMGSYALSARQIPGLTLPGSANKGKNTESAYRYEVLGKALQEIGAEENNNLYPRFVWNPDTGAKSVVIEAQRDKRSIIIAPEFSNISQWTKKRSLPTCNAVWAVSATYKDSNDKDVRTWVNSEDAASIAAYGRFEKVITVSDVKVGTYNNVTTTQADANTLLTNAAKSELLKGAAVTKFSGTMIETPELRFMDDWKCGDLVTCIIDGESFATTIKSTEIKYAEGFETVTPTLGEVEHGEFAELFRTVHGLDDRVSEKELS